jgi:hypothetical protein
MKVRYVAALALMASGWGACERTAIALPLCGGNQNQQTAPVHCTNQRTIDGTTFTVELTVDASGLATATYTLDAPRPVPTAIRVRAHHEISSSPNVNEAAGTISAGSTTASLSVQILCGQIDVKAVFVGNGDARGRVSAPYVKTATDCRSVPTDVTTTVPTTSTPATSSSVPGSTVPGPTTSRPLSSVPGAISSRALPATGRDYSFVAVAAGCLLLVGLALRSLTKRGKTT